MEALEFKQQMKAGKETGSLTNHIMGRNATLPKVGEGATILHWTDRSAYEVMEVSKDYKTVVIQKYEPERIDNNGMSESQEYKYEKLNGCNEEIVWKYGAWRKIIKTIEYTNETFELIVKGRKDGTYNDKCDLFKEIHDENGEFRFVAGKTIVRTKFSKVNIVFGIRQEYYDYSF
ncbi:MAG: hypothetical protein A2X18_07675 [Bacteroidetes bacterium GWF2_40_14]|nr:MAG: hypothetical protein A2X18_07675 [Bacteroidetes bacterium GWF2_40_14]